jgi:hypothetical protein
MHMLHALYFIIFLKKRESFLKNCDNLLFEILADNVMLL